jgi:hypothetical protein
MKKLKEFLDTFSKVIDTTKEQNIVCASGLATALFDHKKFRYCDNGLKNFMSPNYYGDSQHMVGTIGRTRIMVEPGIEFNNMGVYDGKLRKLYNFRADDIKLEDII